MAFRQYGGMNYSSKNNIVSSNLSVSNCSSIGNCDTNCVSGICANVTSANISCASITSASITSASITSASISNGTITTATIANSNVGNETVSGDLTMTNGDLYFSGNTNGIYFSDGTFLSSASGGGGGGYWSPIGPTGIYYSSGPVGIGTSSPNCALGVSGNVGITGNANIYGNATITNTCSATTFTTLSDYRIKDNPEPLNDTYTLDNLNPVIYRNIITNKIDIGLLAHELQEIYSFLVNGEKDGENMQSVNYIGLIGIIIKEMQKLKNEIKLLKEK